MFRPVIYHYKKNNIFRLVWYPCQKYIDNEMNFLACCNLKCFLNYCLTYPDFNNEIEELIQSILNDKNLALLNLKHDNYNVRKLCELKLKYGQIEVKDV